MNDFPKCKRTLTHMPFAHMISIFIVKACARVHFRPEFFPRLFFFCCMSFSLFTHARWQVCHFFTAINYLLFMSFMNCLAGITSLNLFFCRLFFVNVYGWIGKLDGLTIIQRSKKKNLWTDNECGRKKPIKMGWKANKMLFFR